MALKHQLTTPFESTTKSPADSPKPLAQIRILQGYNVFQEVRSGFFRGLSDGCAINVRPSCWSSGRPAKRAATCSSRQDTSPPSLARRRRSSAEAHRMAEALELARALSIPILCLCVSAD